MDQVRLQRSLTLPNNVETVPQLNEFIDQLCEELGIDMSLTMSLNLAMEEAVVNVMDYAYPEGTSGDVHIDVVADDAMLEFIITDTGQPFDPTLKQDADTSLPAEQRPIGGLGIHLIRHLMDTINYERHDGKNILKLIKRIN